jgi:hypothetical protein
MAVRGALALLAIAIVACGKGAERRREDDRPQVDHTPIDITGFPADRDVTSRIIHMPFAAAAARMGSLTFESRAYFVFSRASEEQEQSSLARITEDSRGNRQVLLDTGLNQVEWYRVGEEVFVRQDKGRLRKKSRREADAESFTELGWSSVYQSLALFRQRLRFIDAHPEALGGRQTVRYRLTLAEEGDATAPQVPEPPPTNLPVAPPARWRELARPLSVTGNLWIDAATGVLIKLKLEGRFEIPDRDVRPTQLLVRHDSVVINVGKVKPVVAPEAVPEYRREPAPGDTLSFFREELTKLEAAKAPPTAPAAPVKGKARAP